MLELMQRYGEVRIQPVSFTVVACISWAAMALYLFMLHLNWVVHVLQAVAAMKAALERSPGNEEMTRKISQLQKLTGVSMSAAARKDKENLGGNKAPAGAAADSHSKGKEPVSAAATSPQEPEQGRQQATPAAPAIPEDDLPSPLAEFQRDCMAHALDRGDAEPCVYVLHGDIWPPCPQFILSSCEGAPVNVQLSGVWMTHLTPLLAAVLESFDATQGSD